MKNIEKLIELFEKEFKLSIFKLNKENVLLNNKNNNIRNPKVEIKIEIYNEENKNNISIIVDKYLTIGLDSIVSNTKFNKNQNINQKHIDTLKNIIENILKNIKEKITNNLFTLNLKDIKIINIKEIKQFKRKDYNLKYNINTKFKSFEGKMNIYANDTIELFLNLKKNKNIIKGIKELEVKENFNDIGGNIEIQKYDLLEEVFDEISKNEEKNIEEKRIPNMDRIKNIELKVTLRIGSKILLLKDISNLDIGSVIELDQLANSPLEILVQNKVIGYGEVVIVDGNFGVQITSLINEKEK